MTRPIGLRWQRQIADANDWQAGLELLCRRPSSRTSRTAKPERERWVLGRFLQLGGLEVPVFPTSLVQSERPDFRIGQLGTEIGIEVAELTTAKRKDISRLAEEYEIDGYFPPPLPADAREEQERLLTKEEMSDSARIFEKVRNEKSKGFVGTEEERKLAGMIARLIHKKCESFEKVGFGHFPRNLLVIHENASPVEPFMDYLESYLKTEVGPYLGVRSSHQEIWLLTQELLQIAPEKVAI